MARDRDERDAREDDDDDRPRRRPRRDEDYEPEERLTPRETSPGSTKAAGIIWVIMGALVLLVTLLNLTMGAGTGGDIGPLLCGAALPVLVGAVFLMVGIQTLNGSAKGTLANGIGSIIFAALIGGLGAMAFIGGAMIAGGAAKLGPGGAQLGGMAGTIIMIASVIYILAGAMLLVAGILAIKGKTDYLRWRLYLKQQSGGRGRRDRDYDDEEDDRPRRRPTREEDEEVDRPRRRPARDEE